MIFALLGTPQEEQWEDASSLDFYSLIEPKEKSSRSLRESFVGKFVTEDGLDLLDKLLVLNPAKRLTAYEALQHPYFNSLPIPEQVSLASYSSCHELASKEIRKKRQQRPLESEFSPPTKISKLDEHSQLDDTQKPTYRPVKMKNSDYTLPVTAKAKNAVPQPYSPTEDPRARYQGQMYRGNNRPYNSNRGRYNKRGNWNRGGYSRGRGQTGYWNDRDREYTPSHHWNRNENVSYPPYEMEYPEQSWTEWKHEPREAYYNTPPPSNEPRYNPNRLPSSWTRKP